MSDWKNKFINQWKDFKGTFYSIIGAAHDLFYNKEKMSSEQLFINKQVKKDNFLLINFCV